MSREKRRRVPIVVIRAFLKKPPLHRARLNNDTCAATGYCSLLVLYGRAPSAER